MGWPVSDIGPLPGRQIAPVARWRLQIALVFQVPWVLWFRPIVQQLIHSPASAIIRAAVRMSASGMPVMSATRCGWIVGEERGHVGPAVGVLGDEIGVDVAAFDEQMQEPVQQGQVGAGFDRQVQVGPLRGGGTARVDDDQLGAGLHPVRHPQEQDRMAVGHVGADDEKQVGAVEVGVGAGRSVGTERLLRSSATWSRS